jgi:hypothetical protein
MLLASSVLVALALAVPAFAAQGGPDDAGPAQAQAIQDPDPVNVCPKGTIDCGDGVCLPKGHYCQ